ncbi:MAG TPA: hypothetical protein VHO69_11170 [Phototrophicaceae bacterium]|nr:hypothetical protein [Phototrophicaceae bacterium]
MAYSDYPNGVQSTVGFKGPVQRVCVVAPADGAITLKDGFVFITKATAAVLTLADPVAGTDDGKEITVISKTAAAHTVTIAGGLNGAGAGADVGTFSAVIGNRFSVVAHNGKWYSSGVAVNVTFA